MSLLLLFACCASASDAVEPIVRIVPRSPSAVDTGRGMLCRGYAWLPSGLLPRDGDGRVEDGAGTPRPTRLSVVRRHADGSAAAVQVSTVLSRRAWAAGGDLAIGPGESPSPPFVLHAADDGSSVTVETGPLRIGFARGGGSLLSTLEHDGDPLLGQAPVVVSTAVELDRISSDREATRNVRLAGVDALTCRVVQSGSLLDRHGAPGAFYRVEWRIDAGSPIVSVALEVSGAADLGVAEDLALLVPLRVGGSIRARVLGSGRPRFRVRRESLRVSSFDGRRVIATLGDQRSRLDPAERVGLRVSCKGGEVALVQSRLRAMAPRSVELSRYGVLSAALHAGPFFLDAGYAATAEMAVGVGSRRTLDRVESALRAEPAPSLRGVHPRLREVRDDLTARLVRVVDQGIDAVAGYGDHGDYRYRDGFANLEYDPARSMIERYVTHGDVRHAVVARGMLRHWVTYDRSSGERGTPAGFPWMHGAEHRSLEMEAGHVWAGGLMLGADVFGDPWLRSAVDGLARALVEVARDPAMQRNERSFGWLLLALCDAYRWRHDPETLRAIVAVRDRLLGRQQGRGFIDLDRGPTGRLYAPVPWVTAGITVEALFQVEQVIPAPAARAALVRLVEFLLRDARYADGRYAATVTFSRELSSQLGRSGVAGPTDELLIAAGLGRGALIGVPGSAAEFERLKDRSGPSLTSSRLTTHGAARGLVALRSIADTERRMGRR